MVNSDKTIGLVLCNCGNQLGDYIDFSRIEAEISSCADIELLPICTVLCRSDESKKLIEEIARRKLDRIVIGTCEANEFGDFLEELSNRCGINEGYIHCVNIREHCAWADTDKSRATDRALELISAALRRVRKAEAIERRKFTLVGDVLISGSDVAGLQCAAKLSEFGHRVILLSQSHSLGGIPVDYPQLYGYIGDTPDRARRFVREKVDELVGKITNDARIEVLYETTILSVTGEAGNFKVKFSNNTDVRELVVGAIVLSGDREDINPSLIKLLEHKDAFGSRVAIVFDLSGQQKSHICAAALSIAEILAGRYGVEVKLFCNNIRVSTYGLEQLYKRARQAGVVVVKYNNKPVITDHNYKKVVTVRDESLADEFTEVFDAVIVADSITTNGQNIARTLKYLSIGPDGQLQADNIWLRPILSNIRGVFVIGSATGDGELRSSFADGLAAAFEVHRFLGPVEIELACDAATVDSEKCVLCLTCLRSCPCGAISIDTENEAARISQLACQRCGICVVQCPAGAIELPRYKAEQIAAEVGDSPRTTVFVCENSAYPAALSAARLGVSVEGNTRVIKVPCAGRVDPKEILRQLQFGAEQVKIIACHRQSCKYISGSDYAARRIAYIRDILERAGLDPDRVCFLELASMEVARFAGYMKEQK